MFEIQVYNSTNDDKEEKTKIDPTDKAAAAAASKIDWDTHTQLLTYDHLHTETTYLSRQIMNARCIKLIY